MSKVSFAGSAALAGMLALAVVAGPTAAQEANWGTGGWELQAFTGQINDEPEFGPQRDGDQFQNDAIFGGRAGYVFPFNLFLQAETGAAFPELQPRDGGPRVTSRTFLLGGSVGYNIQPAQRLQIFAAGGADAVIWDPDGFDAETDLGLHYGAGARYYVTPEVALRGDVRWHQVRDALQDTRAAALGAASAADEDLWMLQLSGGVSLFLGGPEDKDGDGVFGDRDACPGTPDGVRVDDRGCPVDGDEDGVPDGQDRCPWTEPGAEVDQQGCPQDSDGDMVVDGIDECPDTPDRATVDERGCPGDSDDDGVLNGLDECPNTPSGAEVDETGCPTGAMGILLRDFVSELNRLTVWFDFNESEIWKDSRPALDLLGKALAQNPGLRVEIQGFTDSVGPEEYNEQLARRRAAAVRNYLRQNFADVGEDQLRIRSFGEARPVGPNDTVEGRQKNRRAMVVVVQPRESAAQSDQDSGGTPR